MRSSWSLKQQLVLVFAGLRVGPGRVVVDGEAQVGQLITGKVPSGTPAPAGTGRAAARLATAGHDIAEREVTQLGVAAGHTLAPLREGAPRVGNDSEFAFAHLQAGMVSPPPRTFSGPGAYGNPRVAWPTSIR